MVVLGNTRVLAVLTLACLFIHSPSWSFPTGSVSQLESSAAIVKPRTGDTTNGAAPGTSAQLGQSKQGAAVAGCSPNGNPCNDGNACTENDRCQDGSCVGDTINCDDAIDCTEDICSDGVCLHFQHQELCPDDNPCTFDFCCPSLTMSDAFATAASNPCADAGSLGGCIHVSLSVGTCDDGNDCTTPDECRAGTCVGTGLATNCGACCDHSMPGGTCQDEVSDLSCNGPFMEFFQGETCTSVENSGFCDENTGACCDQNTGDCIDNTLVGNCQNVIAGDNFTWHNDTFCADLDPPCLAPPPANDSCDNAESIAINGSASGSTTPAAVDSSLDCVFGDQMTISPGVWFKVIGNGNRLKASLCNAGTNYDTKIHIYCSGCASLQCAAGDDDACILGQSEAQWCSEFGTEYLVQVEGYASSGEFELTVSDGPSCAHPACEVPSNDNCENAESILVGGSSSGSTIAATTDSSAPDCVYGDFVDSPGVWFRVAGNGNILTATLCNDGTDYDSVLHVYCPECGAPTCITGVDDNCDATWCSQAGYDYLILVEGFDVNTGDFEISIIDGDPCTTPACVPTGACCLATDTTSCKETTEANCQGTYRGDDTICEAGGTTCQGACCTPNGCVQMPPAFCTQGGPFHGLGSPCDPDPCQVDIGACCEFGLICQITPALQCSAGPFVGVGSVCSPDPCPHACCLPDGNCADVGELDCSMQGGVLQAAGTVCKSTVCPQPNGACCNRSIADPASRCQDNVSASQCDTSNPQITFSQGATCGDVSCDEHTGACCDGTSGICLDGIPESICTNSGKFRGGPCSRGGPGDHWIDSSTGGDYSLFPVALAGIDTTGDCVADETVILTGSATFNYGLPANHVVDTEILSMVLQGTSTSFGPVTIKVGQGQQSSGGPLSASIGSITEHGGNPAIGISIFDVFMEVSANGFAFRNDTAIHLVSQITCAPPVAVHVQDNCAAIAPDGGGQPLAHIVSVRLFTFPRQFQWSKGTLCANVSCSPPTGACCDRAIGCSEGQTIDSCSGPGQAFYLGETCTDVAARGCCADSACDDMDPCTPSQECNPSTNQCVVSSVQDAPEACCGAHSGSRGVDACTDLTPTCCLSLFGTPGGVGTACTTDQACCLTDDSCQDSDPLCCSLENGLARGAGTTCASLPVSCADFAVCGSDSDCNDNNACTDDSCLKDGTCLFTPDDTNDPSDGLICNGLETCTNGKVIDGPDPTCDDGVNCTIDRCDEALGGCVNAPDHGACNDINVCTLDICCAVPSKLRNVTAGTSDPCFDSGGGCTYEPIPGPCTDDNACTQTDTCQDGECIGENPVVCTATDQCHDPGVCDPATGACSNPPKADGSSCNDANACTQTDTCQSGACIGMSPVVCVASDQCHSPGVCDSATGACSNPTTPNGSTCDDDNACTLNDACQDGTCVPGTPRSCNTPPGQCFEPIGTCSTIGGQCDYALKPVGATCEDGNPCTQMDTCQEGACLSGSPVTCPTPDQCHDPGTCNPGTGACTNPPKANGSSCNDNNSCTQTDTCQGGSCTGMNPLICEDNNPCTANICDAKGGCMFPPIENELAVAGIDVPCDDNNVCTINDHCMDGRCFGEMAVPADKQFGADFGMDFKEIPDPGAACAAQPCPAGQVCIDSDDNGQMDSCGVSHTVHVTTSGIISDLDISLSFRHIAVGDLRVLVRHGTTTVVLLNGNINGQPHDNSNLDAIYRMDDEGAQTLDDAAAATGDLTISSAGGFRGDEMLSAFDGMEKNGDWTIFVVDDGNSPDFPNFGIFKGWFLHFTNVGGSGPGMCDDGSSCTEDHCDPIEGCVYECTDTTPPQPVGGCPPGEIEVECGTATLPFIPQFSDNCDDSLELRAISGVGLGDCPQDGFLEIISRSAIATDDCLNSATCGQVVRIVDHTPPQLSCPESLILECDRPEGASADRVRMQLMVSDTCDTAPAITDDMPGDILLPTCGRRGPTLVTFTATDACGNSATCTTQVEVFGEMCCPGTMDGDLTLMPVSIDLRQDTDGPVTTKAKFDIWNENEVRFSGTERCISCWDQVLLSRYNNPNHLLMRNIHTDKAKARIDGLASATVCDITTDIVSVADPLLGVLVKEIHFEGLPRKTERTALNLPGIGRQEGKIVYDQPTPAKLAELAVATGLVQGLTPGAQEFDPSADSTKFGPPTAANLGPSPTASDFDTSDFPSVDPSVGIPLESRASTTEKGSLLYFPNVEIKWDAAGNVLQDTFIELSNDYPESVYIQLYFVNGDQPTDGIFAGDPPIRIERAHPGWNKVDAAFRLTPNEPTFWSILTGQPRGVQPFTILDPGIPPGRPDPDPTNRGGRTLRGFIIGWAMNNLGEAVNWNHLSGSATVIHYRDASAFDYKPVAFQCVSNAPLGTRCGNDNGALDLNGVEYDFAPDKLLMDFYTVGSEALSHPGIR